MNRIKTAQSMKEENYGLFSRWLIPKRKGIKLEQIPITKDL